MGDNFDQQADRLYSLPLSEFTAARDELVKELRRSGDREPVERIKALAKPSVSAWVVNRLYRDERRSYDELLAAGDELRQAVAKDPAALRTATERRRRAVAALLRAAEPILEEAGHRMTTSTRQRVTRTLETLSAGVGGEEAPAAGRLTTDLEPAGFGALLGLAPAPAAQTASEQKAAGRGTKSRAANSKAGTKQPASARAGRRRITEARAALEKAESDRSKATADVAVKARSFETAESAASQAEERAAAAQRAADQAAARATDLTEELAMARTALSGAKRLERRLTKQAETARSKLERLERG